MRKSRFSFLLFVVMLFAMISPAFAEAVDEKNEMIFGDPGYYEEIVSEIEIPVLPMAESTGHFSVAVPTNLPVKIDTHGNIEVSDGSVIENTGDIPIQVKNIQVIPGDGWTMGNFTEDINGLPNFTKTFAISINGSDSTEDGFQFDQNNFNQIETKSFMPIEYQIKMPIQQKAEGQRNIANILFTVAGNTAEPEHPPLDPSIPKSANITRYKTPDGSFRTIHWARGITPPVMPNQYYPAYVPEEAGSFKLLNSDLHEIDPFNNPSGEGYYVSPYYQGNGWYDLNKQFGEGKYSDHNLCFGMAASNILHWWLDNNKENIDRYLRQNPVNEGMADPQAIRPMLENNSFVVTQDPNSSPVYEHMVENFHESGKNGGFPDLVFDFFINGYPTVIHDHRNTKDDFVPTKTGGFFNPVFSMSSLSDRNGRSKYTDISNKLKNLLDTGHGIVISYEFLGYMKAHAITLWGAEYDDLTGKITAIYTCDNNDSGIDPGAVDHYIDFNGQSHLIGMIRYIIHETPNGLTKITNNPFHKPDEGSRLIDCIPLTLCQDGWNHYFEYGKPIFGDSGKPFLNPPDMNKPNMGDPNCQHAFVYSKEGNKIVQTCNQCSYRQWIQPWRRSGYDCTYYGNPVRPYVIYNSGKFPTSPMPNLRYINNNAPGIGTVILSAHGIRVEEDFEILSPPEQSLEQPLGEPELVFPVRPTPTPAPEEQEPPGNQDFITDPVPEPTPDPTPEPTPDFEPEPILPPDPGTTPNVEMPPILPPEWIE